VQFFLIAAVGVEVGDEEQRSAKEKPRRSFVISRGNEPLAGHRLDPQLVGAEGPFVDRNRASSKGQRTQIRP